MQNWNGRKGLRKMDEEETRELAEVRKEEWKENKTTLRSQAAKEEKSGALDGMLDIWSERAERWLVKAAGGVWSRGLHKRGHHQIHCFAQ